MFTRKRTKDNYDIIDYMDYVVGKQLKDCW